MTLRFDDLTVCTANQTLVDLLQTQAVSQPNKHVFTYVSDGNEGTTTLTYAELDARARAIAAELQTCTRIGDRALLLYPQGLEFIAAFFGCLYSGVIAVPAYPPHPSKLERSLPRLRSIAASAAPAVVLTTQAVLPLAARVQAEAPEFAGPRWIATDGSACSSTTAWHRPQLTTDSLAFLQYTSGSTATPKGVMVSHGNLMHNERAMQVAFETTPETVVAGWLPLYHDMGLIGNVLHPLFMGASCVLMSPSAFIQRPLSWLELIDQHRATVSGGPNFAYELCLRRTSPEDRARIDLSSWRVAFNGAEPVRSDTMERFARAFALSGFKPQTFFPCYGLAEATLFAAAGVVSEIPTLCRLDATAIGLDSIVEASADDQTATTLVGCGMAAAGQHIVIANPITEMIAADDTVGEIWISGPSVAQGYWERPEETQKSFQARLADTGAGPFLRTGDLGFLKNGELYVTGRLKDLIIIRGRNHYPQDIEATVEASHPALRTGCSGAFSIEIKDEERLVVVAEAEPRILKKLVNTDSKTTSGAVSPAAAELIATIRSAVVERHELQVYAVVVLSPGSIPKTSSGKVQRHRCRNLYISGDLSVVVADTLGETAFSSGLDDDPRAAYFSQPVAERLPFLARLLRLQAAQAMRVSESLLALDEPLGSYGLDSLAAVELKHRLESAFAVSFPLNLLFGEASLIDMASWLVNQIETKELASSTVLMAIDESPNQYPLSFGQKSLWFLYKLAPESTAYNLPHAVRIRAEVNVTALRNAFQRLVDHHAALRTVFHERNGVPTRVIQDRTEVDFLVIEAMAWTASQLNEHIIAESNQPFCLESGPLMRVRLYQRATDDQILLLTLHHIISDFWSLAVLIEDLRKVYPAELASRPVFLPANAASYSDYVQWEANMVAGAEGEQHWCYWQAQLGDAKTVLDLPVDKPRPAVQTYQGRSLSFTLDQSLSTRFKEFARHHSVTPYMTLLAAFQVLLHRYTGQDDILVGSPTLLGKDRVLFSHQVGYLVNPVILRAKFDGNPTFADFLATTRQTVIGALEHQDLPFSWLVQRLQPERDPGRSPLFQVMFAWQQAPELDDEGLAALAVGKGGVRLDVGGLPFESIALEQHVEQFDLTFVMAEVAGCLTGAFQYNTSLFEESTIARLKGHFETLLTDLMDRPHIQVSHLNLLSDPEQVWLTQWNQTQVAYPDEACLHALFEHQARLYPDGLAVESDDEQLTYGELNRQANQIARRLQAMGVQTDMPVGVCLNRSAKLVAVLLGILKAGGGYVPLDPGYPKERLGFMLTDCRTPVLVTESSLLAQLPEYDGHTLLLDVEWKALKFEDDQNLPATGVSSNLAYVIYTSGSTGKPKGVSCNHRGVVNLLTDIDRRQPLSPEDGCSWWTSLSFDVSVYEIFSALLFGATLHIPTEEVRLNSPAFLGWLAAHGIRSAYIPPFMLREFEARLQNGAADVQLRRLLVGVEPIPESLLASINRQLPDLRIINGYGPTEASICATLHTFDPLQAREHKNVPIGRPVQNTVIYLLDTNLQPVPVGVAGELYIGGDGLARGYLHHGGLTVEKFIPNPFSTEPGARIYRTGDIARFLPDGNIEFLGRVDHQVKIRGHRIEIREIEMALVGHDAVADALVVAREARSGEKHLVAYVVPNSRWQMGTGALSSEGTGSGSQALLRFLRERLPKYMVPSAVVVLREFPVTPNGKIDHRALPAPERERVGVSGTHSMAMTPTEELLVKIWSEVLGCGRVMPFDNFFELGGHSLLATQVIARVRDAFQVELPLRVLFEAQTVTEFATAIDIAQRSGKGFEIPPVRPASSTEPFPLSFSQQRLWFLDQLQPGNAFYNMPGAVRLKGWLNVEAFEKSLGEVVRRHQVLRSRFTSGDGNPVVTIAPAEPFRLETVDCRSMGESQQETQLEQLAVAEATRPFELSQGPLLRARLVRLHHQEHVLFVTLHHIVADGWSIGVLVHETAVLYEAIARGEHSPLPELALQFSDFAVWQRTWMQGEVLERQLTYWKHQLGGQLPVLELPADFPRPAVQQYHGASQRFWFPLDLANGLRDVSRREGVTLFMTLLAGFQTLLHRHTGQDDIIIGSPIANRIHTEAESVIGPFLNLLALRSDLSGDPTFRELLHQIKETTLGAYAHQDVPFEVLVEALQPERDLSRNPIFQVLFQLENTPRRTLQLPGLTITPVETEKGTTQFDLSFDCAEREQGLEIVVEYSTDLFTPLTIANLVRRLRTLLTGVVANTGSKLSELPLLEPEERHQLLFDWNQTEEPVAEAVCVHRWFEIQAAQTPHAVAVLSPADQLTYDQLNRKANQLARRLQNFGVGPETVVGVCLEPNTSLAVALLGILKSGAAYLPLDPAYPASRLTYLLDDAQVSLVVTESSRAGIWAETGITALVLDQESTALDHLDDSNLTTTAQPAHPAYILYTSGSTGTPKGVAVPHQALASHNRAIASRFDLTNQDRVLQFASINFDVAAEEIFPTWRCGATVVFRGESSLLACTELVPLIERKRVTVVNLPASYWQEWVRELALDGTTLPKSLRLVVVGSEKVLTERFLEWQKLGFHGVKLLNAYGTTETTITSAVFNPETTTTRTGLSLPIGTALGNTRLFILDAGFNPVPSGVVGELVIAGEGLARGYVGRPDLTAQAFVPNPFSEPGARMYRTGDLARSLADGTIEILGRADHQVKVRGFRVEVGEIEAVLAQFPGVCEALVQPWHDAAHDTQLVGYVTGQGETEPLELTEIQAFLAARLPKYMVPQVVVLATMPRTPNGKIDRRSLPKPVISQPVGTEPYQPPQTELERTIATVWQEVLKLDKVGLDHNFFELGGHSLKLIQVHGKLRKLLQKNIPVVDLFQFPTIRTLARHLTRGQSLAQLGLSSTTLPKFIQATGRDIAVVGMSGRFPGATTVEAFWHNLRDGIESISFFSDEELLAAGVNPELVANPRFVKATGVLENPDFFDAAFFGFNPIEAEIMDPQQRVFLECAWEAMEDAGYHAESYQQPVGVFAGVGQNTYLLNLYSNPRFGSLTNGLHGNSVTGYQVMIGNDKDFLPTRVSYKLNLHGPSVNVQTACSTSLVAIHMARQSLLNGECSMALAGGVTVNLMQKYGYYFEDGGVASPDGHCRAFDAAAGGTVGGNGVGIVVLKRLEDALTDGDTIHAVIKGSAINNDGSNKVGFTAPSVEGQRDVILQALAAAEVPPDSISYVEAHGTGTVLGDPIEVAALTQAYTATGADEFRCAIGSVKTNVGHLDTAAGVTGLIKTVLALKHGQLPPSLNFSEGNPTIDFESSPFFVNTELKPWHNGKTPRRAGVSSFGLGGTNAHVILEEPPAREASLVVRPYHLLTLSARTATALNRATANLADFLSRHQEVNLADAAFTLQVGRKPFAYRRAVICRDTDEAIQKLSSLPASPIEQPNQVSEAPAVAFLFPGGGAQHVRMGFDLYELEPVYRQHIDWCCQLLKPLLGIDLRDVLFPQDAQLERAARELRRVSLALPTLFMTEYALAQLWKSWGVEPQMMIGHSLGEYTAACLAGVFSLEDALAVVVLRGQLFEQIPAGGMLSVPLSEPELLARLGPELSIAAVNALASCVVSGPVAAIEELETRLHQEQIECRRVPIDVAGHSILVEGILEAFTERLSQIRMQPPRIPFVSNVTGTWITPTEAVDPKYWARHLRMTVRFADGLTTLTGGQSCILLEVGPGHTLSGLARTSPEIAARSKAFPSLRHPRDPQSDVAFLTGTLGAVWANGGAVDWHAYHAQERLYRIPLPTYPFERQRYWVPAFGQNQSSSLEFLEGSASSELTSGISEPAPRPFTQWREIYLSSDHSTFDRVSAIWKELLGVTHLGPDDNFFAVGGHSLLAIQVISRLREAFNCSISVTSLFKSPTVAQLAELIDEMSDSSRQAESSGIVPVERTGPLPLSFAQQRLWFLDQLEPGNPFYNISGAVRLSGKLDVTALCQSLNTVVSRHETLRTRFVVVDGEPRQHIVPSISLELPITDLSHIQEPDRETTISEWAANEARQSFSLTSGPLVAAHLLRLTETEHVLLLTMHHIISDGWSISVLMRETAAFYDGSVNHAPVDLPALSVQYADFAVWQRERLQGDILETQLGYWRQQLRGELPVLELPTDFPKTAQVNYWAPWIPCRTSARRDPAGCSSARRRTRCRGCGTCPPCRKCATRRRRSAPRAGRASCRAPGCRACARRPWWWRIRGPRRKPSAGRRRRRAVAPPAPEPSAGAPAESRRAPCAVRACTGSPAPPGRD